MMAFIFTAAKIVVDAGNVVASDGSITVGVIEVETTTEEEIARNGVNAVKGANVVIGVSVVIADTIEVIERNEEVIEMEAVEVLRLRRFSR